jgi:hypothetical protein
MKIGRLKLQFKAELGSAKNHKKQGRGIENNSPENEMISLLLVKQKMRVPDELTIMCVTPLHDVFSPSESMP